MKQMLLVAAAGFARGGRVGKRAIFLAEMDRVMPWRALCALVQPVYPKAVTVASLWRQAQFDSSLSRIKRLDSAFLAGGSLSSTTLA